MNSNCRKQVTGKICYFSRGRWNKSTKTKERTTKLPSAYTAYSIWGQISWNTAPFKYPRGSKAWLFWRYSKFLDEQNYSLTSSFFPSHKWSCLCKRYFNCIDALFWKHLILMLVSILKRQSTRKALSKSSSLKYTRVKCELVCIKHNNGNGQFCSLMMQTSAHVGYMLSCRYHSCKIVPAASSVLLHSPPSSWWPGLSGLQILPLLPKHTFRVRWQKDTETGAFCCHYAGCLQCGRRPCDKSQRHESCAPPSETWCLCDWKKRQRFCNSKAEIRHKAWYS